MFIFGTKKKISSIGFIDNAFCKSCKSSQRIHYEISIKYFHLYWIPMFPLKKITRIQCDDCDEIAIEKEFSEDLKNKLSRRLELNPVRYKLWQFSGLFLLVLIIIYSEFQINKYENIYNSYLKSPKENDVYFVNPKPSEYYSMKIDSIEKDSIKFIINDTIVSKYLQVFRTNKKEFYSKKTQKKFSIKDIKKMFKDDIIFNIER